MNKTIGVPISALQLGPILRAEDDISDISKYLRDFSILAPCGKDDLLACAKIVKYMSFTKNDIIYRKSEKILFWYYLIQGSVLVGSEMFLPNNSFGQKIDSDKVRRSDCIVLEETSILAFPYEDCSHSRYPCTCLTRCKSDTLSELSWTPKTIKKSQTGSDTSSGYSGSDRASNGDSDSLSWQIGQGSINSDSNSNTVTRRGTSASSQKSELLSLDSESEDDDFSDITFNEISCQDEIKDILLKSSVQRTSQENEVIMNIIQNIPMFSLWTQSLRYAACKLVTLQIVEKSNTVLTKKGDKLTDWGYCLQGILEVRRTVENKCKDSEKHLSDVIETLRYSDCFGADLRKSEEEISHFYLVTNSDNCWLMLINWSQFMAAKAQEPTKLSQVIENDKTVVVMEHRISSNGSVQGHLLVKATIPKLINYLFDNHSPVEENFIENFFLTYNIYLDSTVLVRNEIIDRMRRMPTSRKKCTDVVVKWIGNHFHDMEKQPEILKFLDLIVLMLFRENEEDLAGKIYHACSINSHQRSVTIKYNDRDHKLKPVIVGNGSMINMKDCVTATLDNYPNEFSHCNLFRGDQQLSGLYVSQVKDAKDLRHGDRILQINSVTDDYLTSKAANDMLSKSQLSTVVVKYDPEGFYAPFLCDHLHKKSLKRSKSIHGSKMNPQSIVIEPGYSTLPLKPTLASVGPKNHGIIKKAIPSTMNQNAASSALRKMMKRCKANNSFTNDKKMKSHSKSRSAHTSPDRYQGSNPDLAFSSACIADNSAAMTTSLTLSSSCHLKVETPIIQMRKMRSRCDSQPDLRKMIAASNSGELSATSGEAVIRVHYKDNNDLLSLKPNVRCVYLIINKETEAIEVIVKSLFELNLTCGKSSDYVLCEVSVEHGPMVKQKIIKDNTSGLAGRAKVNARLYLKRRDFSGSLIDSNDMEEIVSELNLSFLDLSLAEIASQIFLESYNKFKSITPSEIIDFVTGKGRTECTANKTKSDIKLPLLTETGTNFRAYLKLGEKYMYFVVNVVCNEHHSISKRSKILKRLIRLARLCKELGNIEVFFSLMNGLDRVEINRLRNTWDRVPNKEMKMYRQMQQILDVSGNMRLLRGLHKSCKPPVIPVAALVTKDLTTIHEVHPTKLNGDSVDCNSKSDSECLINFDKLRILANRIRTFKNSICSCQENESDHSEKCLLLPNEEAAQIEVIRDFISKVDHKETSKNLSSSQMNLNKRKSACINSKKIYDVNFNGLRVQHYLGKLDHLETEDSALLALSYKCEPRSDVSAMTPNISRSTMAGLIQSPTSNHDKDDILCPRPSISQPLSSKESGSLNNFKEQGHLGSFRNHNSKYDRTNSVTPISGQLHYLEPSCTRRTVVPPPPYSSLNSNPPIPPRRRLSVTSTENSAQEKSRSYSHPLMKDEVATHL